MRGSLCQLKIDLTEKMIIMSGLLHFLIRVICLSIVVQVQSESFALGKIWTSQLRQSRKD